MVEKLSKHFAHNRVSFGCALAFFHYPEVNKWANTIFALDPISEDIERPTVFERSWSQVFFNSRIVQSRDSILVFNYGDAIVPVTRVDHDLNEKPVKKDLSAL